MSLGDIDRVPHASAVSEPTPSTERHHHAGGLLKSPTPTRVGAIPAHGKSGHAIDLRSAIEERLLAPAQSDDRLAGLHGPSGGRACELTLCGARPHGGAVSAQGEGKRAIVRIVNYGGRPLRRLCPRNSEKHERRDEYQTSKNHRTPSGDPPAAIVHHQSLHDHPPGQPTRNRRKQILRKQRADSSEVSIRNNGLRNTSL
jgi:hypothetical protein